MLCPCQGLNLEPFASQGSPVKTERPLPWDTLVQHVGGVAELRACMALVPKSQNLDWWAYSRTGAPIQGILLPLTSVPPSMCQRVCAKGSKDSNLRRNGWLLSKSNGK